MTFMKAKAIDLVEYNIDTEYHSAGLNNSLLTKFESQRSEFQGQRWKGQNDPTVHRSHVRLPCPANMIFKVCECKQWNKSGHHAFGKICKVRQWSH